MVCRMSMSNARRATSAEVRAALARAGLNVADLARATGTSHGYWSKRLNGAIALDVDDLATVAGVTGAPVESLVRAA